MVPNNDYYGYYQADTNRLGDYSYQKQYNNQSLENNHYYCEGIEADQKDKQYQNFDANSYDLNYNNYYKF